jgi:uncharacterized membrane protein YdjX (TVP38/TMEM64 family)
LIVVCILASLAVAVFVLPVKDWLTNLLDWLRGLGTWKGPILLVLIYIPLTVLMVPGTIPTLGAGFAFGVARGTVAVSLGSVLGSAAAFALGRTLLRDWVQARIQRRPRLRAIDAAVEKDGFRICLLLRLSPLMPYNLVGYVLGATPMRARDHFFASWIGMLPATALYCYIGHAARSLTEAATGMADEDPTQRWIVLGIGLVITACATVYLARTATRAIRDALPDGSPSPATDATDAPAPRDTSS